MEFENFMPGHFHSLSPSNSMLLTHPGRPLSSNTPSLFSRIPRILSHPVPFGCRWHPLIDTLRLVLTPFETSELRGTSMRYFHLGPPMFCLRNNSEYVRPPMVFHSPRTSDPQRSSVHQNSTRSIGSYCSVRPYCFLYASFLLCIFI